MLSSRDSAVVSMAVEQVKSGIESLTPAAKHVYELAARQVVVEAVANIGVAFALGVVFAAAWWQWFAMSRRHAKSATSYGEDEFRVGSLIALALLSVVFFVFALCGAYGAAVTLGNPEWAAISKLAEMVKGGTR